MAVLVWKGKCPDRGGDAPRAAAGAPFEDDEVYGRPSGGGAWRNRLVLGDQAAVLPRWLDELAGQVALVYVDPPFGTGGEFHFRTALAGALPTERLAVPAYVDGADLDGWLDWFWCAAQRLRDLLADGGSLYVHLDAHVVHYAKVVLDEVFGAGAFQRDIVWRIGWVSGFKSRANNWVRNHDVILYYVKGAPRRRPRAFHKEYLPYPPGYVRRDGSPPRGPGRPLDDVWNGSDLDRLDSIQIKSFSAEKVGFPTQKNEELVARIVRASSKPGDLVLDCFVGSGTTAVVADKLGRRWVGCDVSPVAVHAARKRLVAAQAAPFAVQRLRAEATEAGASEPGAPPRLSVRARTADLAATVEIESFVGPGPSAPGEGARWIDGWCVDWDHSGGPLRARSVVMRPHALRRAQAPVALTATHEYERAGRYAVAVRVFDVLGGSATARLDVAVG